MGIGGNVYALLQVKDHQGKNSIGANESEWLDCLTVPGWLDLSAGDSKRTVYNAKVQESTHIFLCDYVDMKNLSARWIWNTFNFVNGVIRLPHQSGNWLWNPFSFISGNIKNYEDAPMVDLTSDNARMVIDGLVYDILLIDNPMNMNGHFEIYLKFIGGQ